MVDDDLEPVQIIMRTKYKQTKSNEDFSGMPNNLLSIFFL